MSSSSLRSSKGMLLLIPLPSISKLRPSVFWLEFRNLLYTLSEINCSANKQIINKLCLTLLIKPPKLNIIHIFVVSYCITTDWTQLIEVDRRTGWFWRTGYSLLCTVNTGIITKVKLAPSPRAFITVEELFTFHISPKPTSSRLSKQTERVSGALKINDRTFIKQQKV